MEVVNYNRNLLTNTEVLNFLKNVQNGQEEFQKIGKHQTHLATIIYETLQHLEHTPSRVQQPEQISSFLDAISSKFRLTKTERLLLINHCPSTPVEIQLLIENADERLTEDQVADLLSLVSHHFPHCRIV